MKHLPVILVVVISIGILGYLIDTGTFGKIGSLNSLFIFPTSTTGSAYHPSASPSPSYTYTPPPPTQSPTPSPQGSQIPIDPSQIPTGYTASQLSPYFHQIRLGTVSPGYPGYPGQISLYGFSYGYNATNTVDVTAWTIQGNSGSQVIGQAINIYDPSGLTSPSDVRLRPTDYLYIYTGTNSTGPNIHLNKCLGYLASEFSYNPPLPFSCPYMNTGISGLSGRCQNYILSLGACQLPGPNPPIPQNDYGCVNYLNNINYKSCFDTHRSDPDFLSNEWRIWAGGSFLDYYHDQVKLYDRNGLLVDYYQY